MDACVSHNPQNAISGQERPHSTSFRVIRPQTIRRNERQFSIAARHDHPTGCNAVSEMRLDLLPANANPLLSLDARFKPCAGA
jgi:hypothetical protein